MHTTDLSPRRLRTGWSTLLSRLAAAALLFETVSGLVITFGPFHPAVEWTVLTHTLLGVLTFAPLVWYLVRHWQDYADQALERHGLWVGGWMTLARLLRCHPWGNSGLDFVPLVPPRDARWYLPWRYARWRSVNPTPPPAAS